MLVRYVLERSGVDPVEAEKAVTASSNEGDRVIGAEVEILTSWDLAEQVADAIGPKRLGASSKEAAAMNVLSGLQSWYPTKEATSFSYPIRIMIPGCNCCVAGAPEPIFCQASGSAPLGRGF